MLNENLSDNPRFREFVAQIRQQVAELQPDTPEREAALQTERLGLQQKLQGWLQSLANPNLPSVLREAIAPQYAAADEHIHAIDLELTRLASDAHQCAVTITPEAVVEKLNQLAEILAGDNLSAGNLLLSQHIEGIYCDIDGQVIVRTCKLGAFAEVLDLIPRDAETAAGASSATPAPYQAKPRRRGRLNIGDAIDDDEFVAAANEFAVDPQRFAGLEPEWFWEDVLQLTKPPSWAEDNAKAVAEYRLATHGSLKVTAKHFQKSVPVIAEALQIALERYGLDAIGKKVSRATLPNWARDHALEVEQYCAATGASTKQAAEHFGRSEPTIRKARKIAQDQAPGQSPV